MMDNEYPFDLSGGALCLDFANTIEDRSREEPREEHLHDYRDLVAWSRQADIITDDDAGQLLREAARHPAMAVAAFARAIALRETIYRIFSAIAGGATPRENDLAVLNDALVEAMVHARIVPAADGFALAWEDGTNALDRMLRPVVRSAAELLTGSERHRVRECGASDCTWLFLDMSKNGSRRWCDMKGCGNREKARRHRERQHAARA